MPLSPQTPDPAPVERFRATSGRFLGVTSLLVILGTIAWLLLAERSVTGLRIGLGMAFFGVLVWATQLRPRATAYPHVLHLKNSFRDTHVPLALIDEVSVRRTLNVWVGDERYVCIGIGQSLRRMVKGPKSRGPGALLGTDRLEEYRKASTPLSPDQTAMNYDTFVVTRIEGLVEEARRRNARAAEAATTDRPRHVLAWPELAALAVTGVAFLVSLFL